MAFSTKALRALCEHEEKAVRELGAKVAARLKRRIADVRAATCVKDLILGKPHELTHYGIEVHFSVDLCDGFQIVFCANHKVVPLLESGDVDWGEVSRIKIVAVENNEP